MRVLFSFISLAALVLSLFFFHRVGSWTLVEAVLLLILSVHLEIGLRVNEAIRFMTGELRAIVEFINKVTGN